MFSHRSRRASIGLLWLVTLVPLLVNDRVWAQSSAVPLVDEPPGYRALIDSAIAEYDAGHYAEARALFEEAHMRHPNARTLRGLGMSEFELRRYASSVHYLRRALVAPTRPLDDRLRADTQRLLERAHLFVGRIELTLEPRDTAVALDGQPLEAERGAPLVLDVGQHRVTFTAPGYEPQERTITIKGREHERWDVVMVAPAPLQDAPTSSQQAAPLAAIQRDDVAMDARTRRWLWGSGAVAVVAAAVVTTVLLTREPKLWHNRGNTDTELTIASGEP